MSSAEPASGRARSRLALLGQLVLIPLVVVTIGVAVFVLFGLVANEQRTPADYLREIRTGNTTRRWQAAFELARELRQSGSGGDPDLVIQVVETFEWARTEDPQIRRYLAQTLGTMGDKRAIPALRSALRDPDADTRLWAASSLSSLGDAGVADALRPLLADEDPAVRKQVAHGLAVLNAREARDDLARLLEDPVVDVRWNGAVSLAWLDDDRGLPVLLSMLDRVELGEVPDLRADQVERAMVSALAAIARLGATSAAGIVRRLARSDPSLRVRQAALTALERLEESGASD